MHVKASKRETAPAGHYIAQRPKLRGGRLRNSVKPKRGRESCPKLRGGRLRNSVKPKRGRESCSVISTEASHYSIGRPPCVVSPPGNGVLVGFLCLLVISHHGGLHIVLA